MLEMMAFATMEKGWLTMRLIDADEAVINFGFEWDDIQPTREEVVEFIKQQPTLDAVPVVRCKDCKHLMFSDFYGECSKGYLGIVRPDDFCSYGKREDCDVT